MQIYYWEAENARGQIEAANDDDAIRQMNGLVGLLLICRDTGYVIWVRE